MRLRGESPGWKGKNGFGLKYRCGSHMDRTFLKMNLEKFYVGFMREKKHLEI